MASLTVASYNVHRAIGTDGKFSRERILDVLREVDADVFALQEVEAHDSGDDMLRWLGAELGFHAVADTTNIRHDGHYGNGLLARVPISETQRIDLSWRGREPRGAIAIDIEMHGKPIRVVATHLGLRPAERRDQVSRLIKLFTDVPRERGVLLGDLNEWFLWGRPLRRLHRYFSRTPAVATFPSPMPLLALDRVWTHPRTLLTNIRAHSSTLSKVASDHLPLVATLEV